MFKPYNYTSILLQKIPPFPRSRSKKRSKGLSGAILHASPLFLAEVSEVVSENDGQRGESHENGEQSTSTNQVPTTDNISNPESNGEEERNFLSHFTSKEAFDAALELYNNQQVEIHVGLPRHVAGRTVTDNRRWECKGKIRVSFQLCVMCRDVGKLRCRTDRYYLDVIEVCQNRTILCQGCLEKLVYEYVGCSSEEKGEVEACL